MDQYPDENEEFELQYQDELELLEDLPDEFNEAPAPSTSKQKENRAPPLKDVSRLGNSTLGSPQLSDLPGPQIAVLIIFIILGQKSRSRVLPVTQGLTISHNGQLLVGGQFLVHQHPKGPKSVRGYVAKDSTGSQATSVLRGRGTARRSSHCILFAIVGGQPVLHSVGDEILY